MGPVQFPRIVALVGRARSGKDTVAALLVDAALQSGCFCRVERMAAPVKAAVCALFGLPPEAVEGDGKDSVHSACEACAPDGTPRAAMVWLTESAKARLGADFFSAGLVARLVESERQGRRGTIVVPDVRYQADVERVRRHGGLIVKVTRPVSHGGTAHVWEDEVDRVVPDLELINDGTEQSLQTAALRAVAAFRD
jgi:hypothetical protein